MEKFPSVAARKRKCTIKCWKEWTDLSRCQSLCGYSIIWYRFFHDAGLKAVVWNYFILESEDVCFTCFHLSTKVILASEKRAQPKPGVDESCMLKKLFVMFPKNMSEDDLKAEFEVSNFSHFLARRVIFYLHVHVCVQCSLVTCKWFSHFVVNLYLQQFGSIEYVRVVKARRSNAIRNLAYIKFDKQSAAARAYEECNRGR